MDYKALIIESISYVELADIIKLLLVSLNRIKYGDCSSKRTA